MPPCTRIEQLYEDEQEKFDAPDPDMDAATRADEERDDRREE